MNYVCPKCQSNNISIQLVNEVHLKRKHRSILMWILFWWWVELLLWVFLTIPRLIIAIFIPKRHKTINKTHKAGVCQNCGFSGKEDAFVKKEIRQSGVLNTIHNGFVEYEINADYNSIIECLVKTLNEHGTINNIDKENGIIDAKIKAHLKPIINPTLIRLNIKQHESNLLMNIESKSNDGAVGVGSINKVIEILLTDIINNLQLQPNDITKK